MATAGARPERPGQPGLDMGAQNVTDEGDKSGVSGDKSCEGLNFTNYMNSKAWRELID